MSCERCWGDAFSRSHFGGTCQADEYEKLLKERKDNPCTPREQAGQYWDEEKGIDIRTTKDWLLKAWPDKKEEIEKSFSNNMDEMG